MSFLEYKHNWSSYQKKSQLLHKNVGSLHENDRNVLHMKTVMHIEYWNWGPSIINNHWKYGLYFDIATSSISNEHSPMLDCIGIYQQVIWNMNSWWINCWNTYSIRTLSSITFIFNTYFPDELCLVVIDFSANTDWTLDEALIYMYIVVLGNCIFVLQVNVLKSNVGGTLWKLFFVVYIVYVTLF